MCLAVTLVAFAVMGQVTVSGLNGGMDWKYVDVSGHRNATCRTIALAPTERLTFTLPAGDGGLPPPAGAHDSGFCCDVTVDVTFPETGATAEGALMLRRACDFDAQLVATACAQTFPANRTFSCMAAPAPLDSDNECVLPLNNGWVGVPESCNLLTQQEAAAARATADEAAVMDEQGGIDTTWLFPLVGAILAAGLIKCVTASLPLPLLLPLLLGLRLAYTYAYTYA